MKKNKVKHIEISFEDVLPKYDASHVDHDNLMSIDDKIIEEYIDNSNTIFSKTELMAALEEIRTHEAQ